MKLVKSVFLKAPPTRVWQFLTEADRLAEWFHRGEADLAAEGGYGILTNSLGKEGQRMIWGQVIEFEPPTRLVHTFTHDYLQGTETTCTWTLESAEGGTILRLEHTGFEKLEKGAFDMAAEHDKGWDEHFCRLRLITR